MKRRKIRSLTIRTKKKEVKREKKKKQKKRKYNNRYRRKENVPTSLAKAKP